MAVSDSIFPFLSSPIPLPVQTPILNRLRDMLGLDLLTARQITDRSGDLSLLEITVENRSGLSVSVLDRVGRKAFSAHQRQP